VCLEVICVSDLSTVRLSKVLTIPAEMGFVQIDTSFRAQMTLFRLTLIEYLRLSDGDGALTVPERNSGHVAVQCCSEPRCLVLCSDLYIFRSRFWFEGALPYTAAR
jgi:hypothetical protein